MLPEVYRLLTVIFAVFWLGSAQASPTTDYSGANINVPDGEVCQPDDVVSAIKGQLLVAPVDLNVRGLADRIPLQLDDVGSHGETRVGKDGKPKFHAGTDLLADENEPVLAVADGLVVVEGRDHEVLGNYVILRVLVTLPPLKACVNDFLYAHLAETAGQQGKEVTAGTMLGRVGRTGNVAGTPTDLHIEYWTRSYLSGEQNRRDWTRDLMDLFSW